MKGAVAYATVIRKRRNGVRPYGPFGTPSPYPDPILTGTILESRRARNRYFVFCSLHSVPDPCLFLKSRLFRKNPSILISERTEGIV